MQGGSERKETQAAETATSHDQCGLAHLALIVLVILLCNQGSLYAGWRQIDFPSDGSINAIHGCGDSFAVAVGAHGLIAHWDGIQWATVESGTDLPLRSVFVFSEIDAYAVGGTDWPSPYTDIILHWDGLSWQQMPLTTPYIIPLDGVWGSAPDCVFAVGGAEAGNFSVILEWNGIEWTEMSFSFGYSLKDIQGTNSGTEIYAAGGSEDGTTTVLRLQGEAWVPEPLPPDVRGDVYDLWVVGNETYACGRYPPRDFVLRKRGAVWTTISRRLDFGPMGGWGVASDNLLVIGSDGCWHWDGVAWSEVSTPAAYPLWSIWGPTPDLVFAGGMNGCLLAWDGAFPMGTRIGMQHWYMPGDTFSIVGYLDNPGPTLGEVAVFFAFYARGATWFWPSWGYYAPDDYSTLDCRVQAVPTGMTMIEVFPAVQWPDTGAVVIFELYSFGAMIDIENAQLIGELAEVQWGFGAS